MPVAVLLEIEPTVLQSSEMLVMSTKTRTQPLDGIITTHVTLNMSIIRVCDFSMSFGIVCARQDIASTTVTRFSECLFMSKVEYVAKTTVYYNLGFIFVSQPLGSISYDNIVLTKAIAEIWDGREISENWLIGPRNTSVRQ